MVLYAALASRQRGVLSRLIGEFFARAHVWPSVEVWGDGGKVSPAQLAEGKYEWVMVACHAGEGLARRVGDGLGLSMGPREILGAEALINSPFRTDLIITPGKLRALTGPIGSPPIIVSRSDQLIVASSLPLLTAGRPSTVPPDSILEVDYETMTYEQRKSLTSKESSLPALLEESAAQLVELLHQSVKSSVAGRCALLFSGGLDSSILAKIVSDSGLEPLLISVGVQGSYDLAVARSAASLLGLDLLEVSLSEERVAESLRYLNNVIPLSGPMDMALAIMMYEGSRASSSENRRQVVTGQGADELFGGYKKYLRISEASERLDSAMKDDLSALWRVGIPRDWAASAAAGCMLTMPYLDPRVVSMALNTPVWLKISGGIRKLVLRKAAELLGLPHELVIREKKAAQYGSGLDKCIRRIRKRRV